MRWQRRPQPSWCTCCLRLTSTSLSSLPPACRAQPRWEAHCRRHTDTSAARARRLTHGAHTEQVSQRTLGVELAVALFEASPDPFGAASGPVQHAGTPVQQVRPCTSGAMLRPHGTQQAGMPQAICSSCRLAQHQLVLQAREPPRKAVRPARLRRLSCRRRRRWPPL